MNSGPTIATAYQNCRFQFLLTRNLAISEIPRIKSWANIASDDEPQRSPEWEPPKDGCKPMPPISQMLPIASIPPIASIASIASIAVEVQGAL